MSKYHQMQKQKVQKPEHILNLEDEQQNETPQTSLLSPEAVPLNMMKPSQVLQLQRQFGNKFVANLRNQQTNRIQRDPENDAENTSEQEEKQAEHEGLKEKALAIFEQEKEKSQATPYIADNDIVLFQPTFGMAVAHNIIGNIRATGSATLNGRSMAVLGDEHSVEVITSYTTATHPVPGTARLKIMNVLPDQIAFDAQSNGVPTLKKGNNFIAVLEVMTPAQGFFGMVGMMPDPQQIHVGGFGQFIPLTPPIYQPEGLDAENEAPAENENAQASE